ncbi:hypothetical protein [Sorangium sp. So ce131]|uniref:hypothetical protein n=1 Tax=Sorangium sp. So ce131 TaxID=3133282 RepID=UPI003F5EA914
MPTSEEKSALAMKAIWPVEIASEYFDVPVDEVRGRTDGAGAELVDRFELEKRLHREDRIGLDWLAISFGVPRGALEHAMRTPPTSHGLRLAPFQLDVYGSGGRYLLPRRLAEAWVKELLPKHKTWSSLDSRARDLAERLDGDVRACAVSTRFGEVPPAVATCRCIVTWDDVSRAHQEYLDNRKNISLEPDHVGWHAIVDKKIPLSALWRSDLGNMERYLEQRGYSWKAA